jgi:4-hydroxybenzoate polyprenyltransferase
MIDYLRMLRLGDWIKFYPLFPLAGALLAGGDSAQTIVVLIAYFFMIKLCLRRQQYFDADIDRRNRQKVASGRTLAAGGGLTGGVSSAYDLPRIGPPRPLHSASARPDTSFIVVNLLLMTAYSACRIGLKERYLWDAASHG